MSKGDPEQGQAPKPKLLLHVRDGEIVAPKRLAATPQWAKPLVAQAIKQTTSSGS